MSSKKLEPADLDTQQLDIFLRAARRVHRLASDHLEQLPQDSPRTAAFGVLLNRRTRCADARDGTPGIAETAVSDFAERIGAGIIVAFGGRPMVDLIGHWVSRTGRGGGVRR